MDHEHCVFHEIVEKRLNDHGDRIRDLEIKDAKDGERISSLYEKMDELVKIIDKWMQFAQTLYWKVLGAAGVIISVLISFFIWYIKGLPR